MTGKCIQLFQMLVQERFICPPRPWVPSELSAGERFALSQLSCFNFPVVLFTPLLPWVFPLPLLSLPLLFRPLSSYICWRAMAETAEPTVVTGATQSPFKKHDVELPAVFH